MNIFGPWKKDDQTCLMGLMRTKRTKRTNLAPIKLQLQKLVKELVLDKLSYMFYSSIESYAF
jgi:hypothetical protein